MFRRCILTYFMMLLRCAYASQPQVSTISGYDQLALGTFVKTSLRADESIGLAPRKRVLSSDLPGALLTLRKIAENTFWVATIGPGSIYEVSGTQTKKLFESDKALITSIAKLQSGQIAVTTAPSGGVHVFANRNAASPTFFAVKEIGFIYAAVAYGNDLYLVGGSDEGGRLLKMNVASGKVTKLANISESHASAIFIVPGISGPEIYFGGSDLGTLYRYVGGKIESIYSGPAAEVTSIVADAKGRVYASFIDSGGHLAVSTAPTLGSAQTATDNAFQNWWHRSIQSSRVVALLPKHAPHVIWESRQEGVFSLYLDDARGRLFAGTGLNGRVLELHDSRDQHADILSESEHSGQVVAFESNGRGSLAVLAASTGTLSLLDLDSREDEGAYLSQVIDAVTVARFGAILVDNRKSAGVAQWRVGNTPHPDSTWGAFGDTKRLGRYAQFKFTLHSGHAHVHQFRVSFLATNQAPIIKDVRLLMPGQRLTIGESYSGAQPVTLDDNAFRSNDGRFVFGPQGAPAFGATLSLVPNFRTVYVVAHDSDLDLLRYRFVLEKVTDKGDVKERKLLKDWDFEPFASFDVAQAGEGHFRVAVSVDDFHTNGPTRALSDYATSEIFAVTSVLPEFSHAKARVASGKTEVSFKVNAQVPLALVQCVNGEGKWFSVDPVDEITDQSSESYDFVLDFVPNFGSLTCQATDIDQNARKVDIKVN